MPKSRKRGGEKAHNKRVKSRNQNLDAQRKKLQETYTEMFQQKLQDFQNQYSASTESNIDGGIEQIITES